MVNNRSKDLHNKKNLEKFPDSASFKNNLLTDFYEKNRLLFEQFRHLTDKAAENGIRLHDLLDLLGDEEAYKGVPVSIFRSDLSPFEAIVYYLRQEGLSLKEISVKLNRSNKTIWTSNSKAEKKSPKLKVEPSMYIPLHIFSDRSLSTLEHLCVHLHDTLGLKFKECAELLGKNKNTIWTTYRRAKDKL